MYNRNSLFCLLPVLYLKPTIGVSNNNGVKSILPVKCLMNNFIFLAKY